MSSMYSPYGGMQFLPCQRCQAALPPNEVYCRNCGYNNAPQQSNNPIAPQQVSPPMNGPWGGSAPQPTPEQSQSPYGGAWDQPSVSPSPTTPPPQAPNNLKPSSAGLLRSSGGNFFGVSGTPAPTTAPVQPSGTQYPGMPSYDAQGQGQPPTGFAAPNTSYNPPSGTLYTNMPGIPPNNMQPYGTQGQGQPPAGFAAPNTSPPSQPLGNQYGTMPGMSPNNMQSYGAQGQPPAGFAAPNPSYNPPSGTLYTGMPGMPPNNMQPYGAQGQPPAGFSAPNPSYNPPSGTLYTGMPGMPPYDGQGQPPAGFAAPNTSPPSQPLGNQYGTMPGMSPNNMQSYGAQGQPPAGFVAPNTSPASLSGIQYTGMPGMAPNPLSYAGFGQPPAGFTAPNTSPPSQPLGNQYGTMPRGMPPNNMQPYAQQADRGIMQPPAFQETSSARRGPKPWVIVLIVLLIVSLAGGGFFSYTWLSSHNTTATKNPSSVNTTVPKGTPLFADTFKDNANKWSMQSYPPLYGISLANNSLVIEDNQNELLWELVPGNKIYDDFTLSVDGMLSKGQQNNGYGIYIRGATIQNSEFATYYRFEFYGDGTYAIFKGIVNPDGKLNSAKLVDYTLNTTIQKEGTINHILLTAKGSSLALTINGQVLKTITDSSYTHGSIALFVSNLKNVPAGAQAKFSNLAIYPA